MTGRRTLLVLAIALLGGLAPARAGIYFPNELPRALPSDLREITFRLIELREIPSPREKIKEPPPQWISYRDLCTRLEEKERTGIILFADRINLGARYLRLNRVRDAKRILEEAERLCPPGDVDRFLLLANLATTYHLLAETEQQVAFYDQAIFYQRQALRAWPDLYPGWYQMQSQFFRRVEIFYLRLLEVRQAEVRKRPGPQAFQWQRYDDLFEGVKFAGPDEVLTVGGISLASQDKLPLDAGGVLVQLIFWLPFDDRLFWLYAEVLNARNQVVEADQIFRILVEQRKILNRELMLHRHTLQDPAQARRKLDEHLADNPHTLFLLTVAFAPRGHTGDWGGGNVAVEAIWPVMSEMYARQRPQAQPPDGPEPPPRNAIQVEWQPVFVGFVAGILAGVLGMLQLRQWRDGRGNSVKERRLSQG